MTSILVVHPQFDVCGGAELVSFYIIDYLLKRTVANITLLTLSNLDVTRIRDHTGMDLSSNRIHPKLAACPTSIRERKEQLSLVKIAYLHRAARKEARFHDICISTYNEIDFGRPGVQYIHHPLFASKRMLRHYKMIDWSLHSDIDFLERFYRKIVFWISEDQIEGFRRNLTLVNSEFIQGLVRETYGINSNIMYPGFLPDGEVECPVDWDERLFRFIAVGRIARDKRYESLLVTFGRLAREFPKAQFLIVGKVGDRSYLDSLEAKARALRIPLEFATDVSKSELEKLLSESKFFIHAKEFEHFGIAILEAAYWGCIPLVHNSGGPMEIVTPRVCRFLDADELVSNIHRIAGDPIVRHDIETEVKSSLVRFRRAAFFDNLGASMKDWPTKPAVANRSESL